MKARTIPWESIADWYKENEQVIRDVMKFEGLRGAVNEVLRIAPEQPELAALREELARVKGISDNYYSLLVDANQSLAVAERRNADTIAKLELAASMMDDDERGNRFAEVCRLAIKSLKPTESGASE